MGEVGDFSCIDTGQAVTPERVREHFDLKWNTVHAEANETIGDDTPGRQAPEGMSTPSAWKAEILIDLREFERKQLIVNVDRNLPEVQHVTGRLDQFGSTAKRLMSEIPVEVAPQNHQNATLIVKVPQ